MPSPVNHAPRTHRIRSAALFGLASLLTATAVGCHSASCFRPRWSSTSSRPIYLGTPEGYAGSGKSYVVDPSYTPPAYNSSDYESIPQSSGAQSSGAQIPPPENPEELSPTRPDGRLNVPSPPEDVELAPAGVPNNRSNNLSDEPELKLPGAFKDDASLNSEVGTRPPTASNTNTNNTSDHRIRRVSGGYSPGYTHRLPY